jgi:hypothetical protein
VSADVKSISAVSGSDGRLASSPRPARLGMNLHITSARNQKFRDTKGRHQVVPPSLRVPTHSGLNTSSALLPAQQTREGSMFMATHGNSAHAGRIYCPAIDGQAV